MEKEFWARKTSTTWPGSRIRGKQRIRSNKKKTKMEVERIWNRLPDYTFEIVSRIEKLVVVFEREYFIFELGSFLF